MDSISTSYASLIHQGGAGGAFVMKRNTPFAMTRKAPFLNEKGGPFREVEASSMEGKVRAKHRG